MVALQREAWRRSLAALRSEAGPAWTVTHAYADEAAEELCGFHAAHASGFALDVLYASSVPQALIWANTPLDSDRGDAHTCEHLLLGKGDRGRAVAAREEMALATSTAFTGRLRTCYTFQCSAGLDTFCDVLGAKLTALLAPDATDVEISREVCHVFASDGDALDEKGTVYAEMLGSFAQGTFVLHHTLNRLIHGWTEAGEPPSAHPLRFEAGGTPQAIRTATPAHLRAFHNDRYALGSMGMVLAVAPGLAPASDLLRRVHACLAAAGDTPRPWREGAAGSGVPRFPAAQLEEQWLPPSRCAPPGTVRIVRVPVDDATAPGQLVAAWPDVLPPAAVAGPSGSLQLSLLQLLVELVAGGSTSELHSALVATETRTCDVGATSVSGYVSTEPGRAVCVGLGGLPPAALNEQAVRRACEAMRAAFAKVAAASDGSPELQAFNRRALSHLRTMQRASRQFLSAPPRFGVRGVHDAWLDHLHDARRCTAGADVVVLSFVAEAAALEALLTDEQATNVWASHIAAWGLAARLPVAVATRANPGFAAQLESEREARMRAAVDGLVAAEAAEAGQAVPEDAAGQAALRAAAFVRFRRTYDAATAVLDAAAAAVPSADPPPDPPLEEDAALDGQRLSLPGGGRLLAARFVGMTGGHMGVALSLAGVPPRLLGVLAALPTLLRNVGVTSRAGEALDYRELCCRLQREVLYVGPGFTCSRRSGRCELQVRAAGLTLAEAHAALGWLEAMLCAPDLSARSLPRVRDGVDAALSSSRAALERRGEFWVDGIASACLGGVSPVFLLAENHAARAHALHRLRWRLRDVPPDVAVCRALLALLAPVAATATRSQLDAALLSTSADGGAWPAGVPGGAEVHAAFAAAPPAVRATLRAAAADLRCVLPAVPDAALPADWPLLCAQLAADLAEPPGAVLRDAAELLVLLRCRGRARAFMAAGPAHFTELAAALRALVARLPAGMGPGAALVNDAPPSPPSLVLARAAARGAALPRAWPPFLAVVVPRIAVGALVSMRSCAAYADAWDDDALLDALAAQTVAGGGPHSLFMRGWAAGLAYSCGVSVALAEGRLRYYADTCPDAGKALLAAAAEVAQDAAMAPVAWRAEYALAQCFTSRAGTSMPETRAEAAAADEADGSGAERVRALRAALLRLRQQPGLAAELHRRAPRVLGALLPGVLSPPFARDGWSGAAGEPGATLVVVGPEAQAAAVEAHLLAVGAKAAADAPRCLRIYERDFWVVNDAPLLPRLPIRARLAASSAAAFLLAPVEVPRGALLLAAAGAAAVAAAVLARSSARV